MWLSGRGDLGGVGREHKTREIFFFYDWDLRVEKSGRGYIYYTQEELARSQAVNFLLDRRRRSGKPHCQALPHFSSYSSESCLRESCPCVESAVRSSLSPYRRAGEVRGASSCADNESGVVLSDPSPVECGRFGSGDQSSPQAGQ